MTIHSTEGLVVDTGDVYSNGSYQYLGGRLGELDLVWFEFCVIRLRSLGVRVKATTLLE